VLCTRELQTSIGDSVYRLLVDTIERLGLEKHFTIQRDEIRSGAGSLFLFEGLRHNTKRIKSLEGVDICWVEEADAVSNASWDILIPTIRKAGSEIWISFNRDLEDDPVYRRFVEDQREGSVVRLVLLEDNPWAPAVLRDEAYYDSLVDPERHAHIWLGEPWSRSDAQVFRGRYTVREFETPADSYFYVGADFGFAVDPDVIVRAFISDDETTLYVDAEAYGHGVDIVDTPALFESVLPVRTWPVRADSARPEIIAYLNQQGMNVFASHKGAGSVEDGIRYLLGFHEIVIHPRCRHTIDEFHAYSYKTDPRTGDVLPMLLDKHNHCIDALRYGLEEVWRTAGTAAPGLSATVSAGDLGL
jgi:phage terminase large subunit